MDVIKILALSGSLRKASYNTAAIQALMGISPKHVDISLGSIANLPLFNPDLEGESISALEELIYKLRQSDGLILASPEYAHGISGPLKNALDWLVSGVEFPYKPIMLINTSPRASHAQKALREVIQTMSGTIIDKACVTVPLLGSELDVEGIIENKNLSDSLISALDEFCEAIESQKINRSSTTDIEVLE